MTEKRIMSCTTCTAKFDHLSSLLQHMASHSDSTVRVHTQSIKGDSHVTSAGDTKSRPILLTRSAFLRLQPFLKQKNAPNIQVVVSEGARVTPIKAVISNTSPVSQTTKSTVKSRRSEVTNGGASAPENDEGDDDASIDDDDDECSSCAICHRTFKHRTSLVSHCRQHAMSRSCGVCGHRAVSSDMLLQHLQMHSSRDSTFKCNQCDKTFVHAKSLYVHKRNHTGAKPYVCQYCHKAFRHWHKHKVHVRIHTGERPYVCEICGWGFPRNDEKKRHMRTHEGAKAFRCVDCGIACATQLSLVLHQRLHHRNDGALDQTIAENRGVDSIPPGMLNDKRQSNEESSPIWLGSVKDEQSSDVDERDSKPEVKKQKNECDSVAFRFSCDANMNGGCCEGVAAIKTEPIDKIDDLELEVVAIKQEEPEIEPAYVISNTNDDICDSREDSSVPMVAASLLEPKVDLTELAVDVERIKATIRNKIASNSHLFEKRLCDEANAFVYDRRPIIEQIRLMLKQKLSEGELIANKLSTINAATTISGEQPCNGHFMSIKSEPVDCGDDV